MEQIGNYMMWGMMLMGGVVVVGATLVFAYQWWLRRGAMRGR